MTGWKYNIVNAVTLTGLLMLLATILVIDAECMNGITVAKYLWFYASVSTTSVAAILLALLNGADSKLDPLKTITIGIMTVVIIGMSRNFYQEMMNAEIFLLVVISFLLFDIYFQHNKKSTRTFHFLLIGLGLTETAWGFCQLYARVPGSEKDFQLLGSFYSTYAFAVFLAVIAPIALYWTLELSGKVWEIFTVPDADSEELARPGAIDDFMLFLLSVFGLTGIVCMLPVAGTVVAWIVAACGCAFVLYFKLNVGKHVKVRGCRASRPARVVTVLLVAIACCAVAGGLYKANKDAVDKHLLTWKISLDVLTEHPLTGVGIGKFHKVYGEYQSAYFKNGQPTERELALANMPHHPVNDFFRVAAEIGLPGFVLCMILLGMVLARGLRDRDTHPERVAVVGALVAILLCGLISSPVKSLPLSVVFILLLAMCLPHKSIRVAQPIRRLVVLHVVMAGIAVSLALPRLDKYQFYEQWARGRLYYKMKVYAAAANLYAPVAKELNHPVFLYEYGNALYHSGRHAESIDVLTRLTPVASSPEVYNIIGKNHQALGQYELAEQYFREAHYLAPSLILPNYLLAKLYHVMGLREKTLEYARQVVAQPADDDAEETLEMKTQMETLIRRMN